MAEGDELQALAVELLVHSARFTRLAARRAGADVPAALWRALSQVEELGPLRVSELAVVDRCSQPTATTLVQRLAERGWVTRTTDPDDARAVLVEASEAGRQVLTEQRARAGAALVPDLARLGSEERRHLAQGITALRALMSNARRD